jgi:protein phosphatase
MDFVTPLEPPPVRGDNAPRETATSTRHAVHLTPWVRLELAAASARGRRREVNEDAHSALSGATPLYVVADGVGGGAMAAQASRELVHRLHDALDAHRIDPGAIRNAVLVADREVGRSIARETDDAGAATMALCAGTGMLLSRWLIAWVGDCRVYRVSARGEEPAQLLTVDDTYEHLSEVPPPGGAHDDPARMVGNGAVSSPNVDRVALAGGEMLVLCSDGIHKHVGPGEMSDVLHGSAPLARRCARLLALARARGSRDDATVLVIRRETRQQRVALLVAAGVLVTALATALVVAGGERGFRASQRTPTAMVERAVAAAAAVPASEVQPSSRKREQI